MKRFLLSRLVGNGLRGFILLTILLMSLGYSGTDVAYAAPPVHDDFDSAKTITGIEYHDSSVNTTEATPTASTPEAEIDDPDNIPCPEDGDPGKVLRYGYATVWYKYTPPEDQAISLNTLGSNYDTFVAVWTGTRGNLNLVQGSCNDDTFEGQTSETGFIANGGTTYYIEVAQFHPGTVPSNIGGTLFFNAYITNTQVYVKKDLKGSYYVPESGGLRRSLINLNSGPVEVRNISGNQLIAAERVIYSVNNVATSFSEMMGLPNNQLDNVYWLPWYNNKDANIDTQLRFGNVSNSSATIHVKIGGVEMADSPFVLAAGASIRKSYKGIDRGPVHIESNVNIVAAERVIYKVNNIPTSFSEMMALPESQLDTIYWMPWYNNKDANIETQLRIGNVSNSIATVNVTIGGIPVPGSPFTLGVGKSMRRSFPGINRGPVRIQSNVPIIAAERVIYKVNNVHVSFSEMMGLPNGHLSNIYWMPWYNNKDATIETQLRFGNVSNQQATVHVTIGGIPVPGSPFILGVGKSTRKSFLGIDRGPVKIESNVNIVAAERVIYKRTNGVHTSFSEMMGVSNSILDTKYWMPWYNNIELNTQLRFALP